MQNHHVTILVAFLLVDYVYAYHFTCNSQKSYIGYDDNKTDEIPPPILYRDVESILRVLEGPQYKYVTGIRELLQYYEGAKKRKGQLSKSGNVKKHPLIVLEGLSGSGKTTLAMGLLNKINSTYYHSPPAYMDNLKKLFSHNFILNSAYAFLGQYVASYDVETLLAHSTVIMDRYWHSSAAFAIASAINNFPEKYMMPSKGSQIYNWPRDLLKPDIVFFLEVDEATREDRLNRRNNLTREATTNIPDDLISSCSQFLKKFYEDHNFPGVIGCIDCTHVSIHTPKINDEEYPEHLYVNRKGYHSINVQLICDSQMKKTNVIARYPGSTHDSFIWANSNVLQLLRNLHVEGHLGYYLLGDSGYPQRTWLMKPLEYEPLIGTPESNYNRSHRSTRIKIETCNSVLKMKFRCLHKDRVLHYKPDVACRIINACVVLHNMCIQYNVPLQRDNDRNIDSEMFNNGYDNENQLEDQLRRINPELIAGRQARVHLIRNLFAV